MASRPKSNPWLLWISFAMVLALGVYLFSQNTAFIPMRDFVEYWSAAKVLLSGGNPYEASQLRVFQEQALGQPVEAVVMMWNPPYVLPMLLPFGLLPSTVAHALFLLLQLGALLVSAWWLWRVYEGDPERWWVGIVVSLLLGPSVFLFWYGQISGLLLLGIAGFLHYQKRGKPVMAGLLVALTAIKPHLLFGLGLLLLLDAVRSRETRKSLAAGVLVLGALTLFVWWMKPELLRWYVQAGIGSTEAGRVSLKDWAQPLLGYWLRMGLAPHYFVVQFLPMGIASGYLVWRWVRQGGTWEWNREMPGIVFLSALCAPYGAWVFDLVVLLVPVLFGASKLTQFGLMKQLIGWSFLALLTLVVVNGVKIAAWFSGVQVLGLHSYIFVTPAYLLWFALVMWCCKPR